MDSAIYLVFAILWALFWGFCLYALYALWCSLLDAIRGRED